MAEGAPRRVDGQGGFVPRVGTGIVRPPQEPQPVAARGADKEVVVQPAVAARGQGRREVPPVSAPQRAADKGEIFDGIVRKSSLAGQDGTEAVPSVPSAD